MCRFVLYFVCLIALQLMVGISFDLAGMPNYSEFSLPIAGVAAALLFLRRQTLSAGLSQLRQSARAVDDRTLDVVVIGVVALAALGATALGIHAAAGLTVFAALTEEIVLRAVPLLVLAAAGPWKRSNLSFAIALSAIVFTLGHDVSSVWLTAEKLAFGVTAAVAFLVTSRIWVGFGLHGLTNMFAVKYFSTASSPTHEVFAGVSILCAILVLVVLAGRVQRTTSSDLPLRASRRARCPEPNTRKAR